MKWIIAGGRDYGNRLKEDGTPDEEQNAKDYDALLDAANRLVDVDDTVISGTAKGADQLGERYAKSQQPFGVRLERFPADWEKYGKRAGFLRNHQMALEADGLIAFWDGKSKGTKNMIEEAHKARLVTHVVYY